MGINLLFHNIGFISGGVIALFFSIFVYLKDRNSVVNKTFSLSFFSIFIFVISHAIGVNIVDPIVSRNVLMLNLSVIWIAVFLTHCSFALVDAVKKQIYFMYFMYISAIVLTIIHVIFPDTYLLPSIPKLYFVNYYNPGNLQWIMRIIFDIIVPVYFLGYLVYAYHHVDAIMRNRLKYFFISLLLGYSLGSLAIPLVYDIAIDPLYAAPFVPILAIPMAYAIVRYNLLDIRIVAKRALFFAVIVAVSSFSIFMVGYINSTINILIPNFPFWVLPLLAGFAATILSIFTWQRFRETDELKYEFITIMTHKLRTPLTSIRWSVENLTEMIPSKGKTDIIHINESVNRLIELINALAEVSSEDRSQYTYAYETIDFTLFLKSLGQEYSHLCQDKKITFAFHDIEGSPLFIHADRVKMRIVMQSLLDNALTYSNVGGNIILTIKQLGGKVFVSVQDTGIGFDKEQGRRLFSQLYRTDSARAIDTEGTGIGLFVARKIIEHHNGTISAHSDGVGRGSTFVLYLPIWKGT